MKKNLCLFATFILAAVLLLGSCKPKEKEDPKVPEEFEYKSEIDFTGWDIAAAGIEDEVLKDVLDEVCPNYGSTGTEDIELFLLGAYASAYDSQIEAVLEGGGACVLTEDLSLETISAFLEVCGLDGDYANEIDDIEHLAVFGVSGYSDIYLSYHETLDAQVDGVVTTKTIVAETDTTAKNIKEEGEYKEPKTSLFSTWEYAYLYGAYRWLALSIENRKDYEEYDPYEIDEDYFAAAPARVAADEVSDAADKRSKEIEKIAQGTTYTADYNVTIRNIGTPKHSGRDQDTVKAITIGMIATYTIHQIFVFPGGGAGANSGDYYVVNSNVEWVNCGAFIGIGQMVHTGIFATNLRYCGFMPKECAMVSTPIVKNGYSIKIPANGSVLPETVNRKTMHKETRSFNIGFNASIGAKGGKNSSEGTGPKGPTSSKGGDKGINGNAGLTLGWGWNHTKEYATYDWDVTKVAGSGASAGHKLTMSDDCLPVQTFKDPGFEGKDDSKIVRKELYSSTFNVHESWIWQIPETQTDDDVAPLKIKFRATPIYTWMDHFKMDGTLITREYGFGPYEKTISINPTNREGAGTIRMKNTMKGPNGEEYTVSNVTFVDAKTKDTLFVDNNNTYKHNTEMVYGMKSKYQYEILFKAGRKARTAKWYTVDGIKTIGINQEVVIDDLDYVSEEVGAE